MKPPSCGGHPGDGELAHSEDIAVLDSAKAVQKNRIPGYRVAVHGRLDSARALRQTLLEEGGRCQCM